MRYKATQRAAKSAALEFDVYARTDRASVNLRGCVHTHAASTRYANFRRMLMRPIDVTATGESRGYNIAVEWKMHRKGRTSDRWTADRATDQPIVFPPFFTPRSPRKRTRFPVKATRSAIRLASWFPRQTKLISLSFFPGRDLLTRRSQRIVFVARRVEWNRRCRCCYSGFETQRRNVTGEREKDRISFPIGQLLRRFSFRVFERKSLLETQINF